MQLCVLIASRGRPEMLRAALTELSRGCARPDLLRVHVGVDEDDDPTVAFAASCSPADWPLEVHWRIGPRPSTLAQVYNALVPEDDGIAAVVGMTDDYRVVTPGWDEALRDAVAKFPHGFGVTYFRDPLHHAHFPSLAVVGMPLLRLTGFYAAPWFPFWFGDTWWHEVGEFIGCKFPAACAVEPIDGRGGTQGLRDLAFWVHVFRKTRRLRFRDADAAIARMYPDRPHMAPSLETRRRGATLLFDLELKEMMETPEFATLEARTAATEPSARYRLAKAQAELLLRVLDLQDN